MRVPVFFSLMLLLAASCSGGGSGEEEKEGSQSSLTAVSRPIVDIVPAADIEKDGQPVDPALVFAPDAPRITVVAQVGEVTGSPMDITWFQVTDEGEEELFTHTVEVSSFEAAYSVGKSAGTLTPGTYRVEATLEGESLSTQFEVQAPEETGATGQGATSGPPSSGDSGAVATPASDPPQSGEASADFVVMWDPVDPDPPKITLVFSATLPGGDGSVEAQATMGGNTRSVSYALVAGVESLFEELDFNPCVHPGGSDLPGTEAEFSVTMFGAGGSFIDGGNKLTTLGPDETPPVLEVTSDPPPGSKVEPGQTITVSIVGRETKGGTWQTGVKQIKLTDFDTGAVLGDQIFGEEALPCAQKAWSKGLDVVYTVPEDAPPEIHLMAEAFDFAEKRGSFGLSYYTGEVWTGGGALTSSATYPDGSACTDAVGISYTFGIGDDGAITGTGLGTHTEEAHCPFPAPGAQWETFALTVSGRLDGQTIRLEFDLEGQEPANGIDYAGFGTALALGAGAVDLAVQGTSATGTVAFSESSGNPPAIYAASGPVTASCTSGCGSE